MKRIKKLTFTILSFALTLCLMMIGIYASTTPNISIVGTVTFTTSASQISVTGTIIDGYTESNQPIDYLDGQLYHYYDYTDREKTTLANWTMNNGEAIYFMEDSSGVTDIKIKFDFVNNSPFYTVARFENVAGSSNVAVDFEEQVIMDIRGMTDASKSTTITYSVIDDSLPATTNINFVVTFDRFLPSQNENYSNFLNNINSRAPLTNDEIEFYQDKYEQERNKKATPINNQKADEESSPQNSNAVTNTLQNNSHTNQTTQAENEPENQVDNNNNENIDSANQTNSDINNMILNE